MADPIHTFRHEAMATHFEIRIAGGDAGYAGQAAQAAFAIVDRMETQLSRFQESSETSRINGLNAGEVIRVSPECLDCLEQALDLHVLTRGAFDPAYASGAPAARGQLLLDRDSLQVGLEGPRVALDLGAIGKGFALDTAAEELRAWDIAKALVIAGGSSLLALAAPDLEGGAGWEISLGGVSPPRGLTLENRGLGSSGTAVKGSHIIDPRTGAPAAGAHRTWALAPSAAAADALSTAWMILPRAAIESICASRSGIGAIVQPDGRGESLWSTGDVPAILPLELPKPIR